MSDILCVTNRALCRENFLTRIERIAAAHPRAIVLREKDLSEVEYEALCYKVLLLCKKYGVPLILSGHADLAKALGCAVQQPFSASGALTPQGAGVSVHSVGEAIALADSPAAYLVAGHIWNTACKADLAARGVPFLQAVAQAAYQPVFAIGGVTPARMADVYAAGACGACVMSALMTHDNPAAYLAEFENKL